MADEKIKVTLKRVLFKRGGKKIPGSGVVGYDATIDKKRVGSATEMFKGAKGKWRFLQSRRLAVHELGWSAEVNVKNKYQVVIKVECKDNDKEKPTTVGTVNVTLTWPYTQAFGALADADNDLFMLQYDVELYVGGGFGRHQPNRLFACRQHTSSATATSVSGGKTGVRMEIHPVRPTPTKGLPTRPRSMRRRRIDPTQVVQNTAAVDVEPGSALNVIPNPSVIPILKPPLPERTSTGRVRTDDEKDKSTSANDRNVARIEYSWYYPKMAFDGQEDDLEWKVVTLTNGPDGSKPQVEFLGKKKGTKIKVWGKKPGEVLLELHFKGSCLAKYRALVMQVKEVKCRFNILKNKDHPDVSPRSTPADIVKHLAVANRFLYQAGLKLVLDDNDTKTDGAKDTTVKGIFEIEVDEDLTKGVAWYADAKKAALLNHRKKVINFNYIYQDDDGADTLGLAVVRPANNAGDKITDAGTPSSSWKKLSGVQYVASGEAATADPVEMKLRGSLPSAGGADDQFAMFVMDNCGDPTTAEGYLKYGNTIAHEFGHVLNLPHRNDPSKDSVNDDVGYPLKENLMHYNNPGSIAQDLDVVQTRAIHQSKLLS